jgi:hypothetical protein
MGPSGQLFTTTEAAAVVGVTERTLANYWRANAGPERTRVGSRIFIWESHLAAWQRQRRDRLGSGSTRPTWSTAIPHPTPEPATA